MQKGTIGVTTDNIFPVIKKFLYSDHEIFLRELVSNAVDASQKLRTLSSFGEYKGELGDLDVTVTVDKEKGTLTVTDRGIGMTAEDIAHLRRQEKFDSAYTLNASIGKNWYIHRQYTLGFSLEIKNILNNQDIRTGGYEQTRLTKNTETTVTTYQAFDSKYFYMFGTTYYLNLYFRF